MSIFDDKAIARDIIMDNYQNPHNKKTLDKENTQSKHMASDSCIDDITVYMHFDGETIDDVSFNGIGCTISTASTSILTDLIKGKTKGQAKTIIHNYMDMLDEKPFDADLLQEAVIFKDISKSANRIHCATIGWRGAAALLGEKIDE